MYQEIEIEEYFDGKLAIAYLNQPQSFNSLNRTMLKELYQFVDAYEGKEHIRCLAISGRGKAFCSGQNLKDILDVNLSEDTIASIMNDYYNPLVKKIAESPKPIISLVNGPAVGAGAMLALICDFSIATESAYFSQAFVNIGLIPDTGGTYFLPRLLGRQMANYLAFTGVKVSAAEALQLGLIAKVFPDEDFESESFEILEQLSNAPTLAIGLMKRAMAMSSQNTLDAQLSLESELQQMASETQDFKEGVNAFLEKRKPVYRGE